MTPPSEIDASGWDRPLDVDWDFQLRALREEIRDAAPAGKTGSLKRAFSNKDTVTINKKKTVITITVQPPDPAAAYAGVVNFGSGIHAGRGKYRIPRIDNLAAKTLRFFWKGAWRFFKWVMHPGIEGQHYVERGIVAWWNKITKGARYTIVKWRRRGPGEKFGDVRGTVSAR